jgi:hypothetical protein
VSITWSAVQSALQNWVEFGSGLPDAKVIWAQQPTARPAVPFITLRILSLRVVGRDWMQVRDAVAPAEGAEIEHVARGVRECLLGIQVFGAVGYGANAPTAILGRVLASAKLPSVEAPLRAAGIGLSTMGAVTSIDGLVGVSTFEPRAIADVRFFLAEEVAEFSTFIDTVEIENTTTGASATVSL